MLRQPCGCSSRCGDDGDYDGPGTCKGLPEMPKEPLVEVILVPRSALNTIGKENDGRASSSVRPG